jgi:flagellar basal body P-ring formation protein FlgA
MHANHSTRLVAVAVAALWVAVPVSGADIALRKQATPQSTIVRLGDVADVRADDKQEAKKLAAMPLMPSPAPGTQRFIRMREVQDLLAAQGADMNRLSFRGELVVEISAADAKTQEDVAPAEGKADSKVVQASAMASPAAVSVDRRRAAWKGEAQVPESVLTEDDYAQQRARITQVLTDYLNQSAGKSAAWKLKFDVPTRYLDQMAAATSPCKCAGGSAPWIGKQRFVVSFKTAKGDVEVGVPTEVSLPQPVVVATRAIERGAIVTAADLEVRQTDNLPSTNARHLSFDSTDKLVGMEATKGIQVGDTIFDDAVRSPLLVKRGDQVSVYARGGGISVRTVARARQDGARGELVQLESIDTKERYDAVVVGSREAVVFAGNATPTPDAAERPSRTIRR